MWLVGLGVWFSLWVREVPGSNPGRARAWSNSRFLFTHQCQIHRVNSLTKNRKKFGLSLVFRQLGARKHKAASHALVFLLLLKQDRLAKMPRWELSSYAGKASRWRSSLFRVGARAIWCLIKWFFSQTESSLHADTQLLFPLIIWDDVAHYKDSDERIEFQITRDRVSCAAQEVRRRGKANHVVCSGSVRLDDRPNTALWKGTPLSWPHPRASGTFFTFVDRSRSQQQLISLQ